MTIEEMQSRLKGIDISALLYRVFINEETQEVILLEQKGQLLEGKTADNVDLRPYYSEDLRDKGGWFHSPESAGRYRTYKGNKTYPSESVARMIVPRNDDAPNLIWNGRFHSELGFMLYNNGYEIYPKTPYAENIFMKYNGNETFGLNDLHLAVVNEEYIVPELLKILKQDNGWNE